MTSTDLENYYPSIPLLEIPAAVTSLSDFPLTPGTDMFPFFSDTPNRGIIGRNGNDVILVYDAAIPPGSTELIHKMNGDGDQTSRGYKAGKDIFILGDWRTAYYKDSSTASSGIAQYAVIQDFQTSLDTIRLYGAPENYFLVQSGTDTQIFLGQAGVSQDLIATVSNTSGLTLTSPYFQFLGTSAPGPSNNAIKQIGTIGVDEVTSVAVGPGGAVYAGGYSSGSLAGKNAGSLDGFLARYDSQGNGVWSRQTAFRGWDLVWDIDTDAQGNVYAVRRSKSGTSPFSVGVTKYNSSGTELWTKNIDGFSSSLRIDVANDGLSFAVSGVSIIDGSIWDAVVAKYDANGNRLWYDSFGSTIQPDESYAVTTDNQGNVITAGWTFGKVGQTKGRFYDVWVSKFDPAGTQLWAKQLGSTGDEFAWGIDTDSLGNSYVGGFTAGSLGGRLEGPYDGFLAKYDSLGNQQWVKQIGTSGDDEITNLVVGADNNIYVTGFTDGDFGGPKVGLIDAFVAKYNSDGVQLWLKKFGSVGADYPRGISIDNTANAVYISGVTDASLGAANLGSHDGWIAKVDANSGTILNF